MHRAVWEGFHDKNLQNKIWGFLLNQPLVNPRRRFIGTDAPNEVQPKN